MPEQQSESSKESVGVPSQFDRAAARYDLMTALNPGYHRHLLRAARTLVAELPDASGAARPAVVLDVGCGSGSSTRAVTAAFEEQALRVRVVGIDASPGMLAQARAKSWPAEVSFVCESAESLAQTAAAHDLGDVDGIMAAYLFRNVSDPDGVASQMFDLLRPGGTLVVQEYSVADSRRARWVWTTVCRGVVIPLSAVLRSHPQLYRYLWRSVLEFDRLADFCQRLSRAGFVDIAVTAAPGWQRGILHTIRARRPSSWA